MNHASTLWPHVFVNEANWPAVRKALIYAGVADSAFSGIQLPLGAKAVYAMGGGFHFVYSTNKPAFANLYSVSFKEILLNAYRALPLWSGASGAKIITE